MTIELSVILWLRLLISPLVSSGHCIISDSLVSPLVSFDHCIISHSLITSSNFPFGIFWPICYQSFFDYVFYFYPMVSFDHCIISHSLWYLLTIVLSVILWLRLLMFPLVSYDHCIISHSLITSSNFPFGIVRPLYYQSFFDYVF